MNCSGEMYKLPEAGHRGGQSNRFESINSNINNFLTKIINGNKSSNISLIYLNFIHMINH